MATGTFSILVGRGEGFTPDILSFTLRANLARYQAPLFKISRKFVPDIFYRLQFM